MIEIGSITPPSVQLLPAKRYTGAPIGTSYDIRVYTGNKLSSSFSEKKITKKKSYHRSVPVADNSDERMQRRSTVRLGIRLLHKICPDINLSANEPSPQQQQQPTVPRSLRLRLSPKARKLIKQTSLIIHGSNSNTNNSNGTVKSIATEADVTDSLNKVS